MLCTLSQRRPPRLEKATDIATMAMARSTMRRRLAWETLEDGPTIRTIRKLLEVIADERLLASLTKGRGRGRMICPCRWRGGSWS